MNQNLINNPLNISPLLTKSISCFDPIQQYDFLLPPNQVAIHQEKRAVVQRQVPHEGNNNVLKFNLGTILNNNSTDESPFKGLDSIFKVVKDLN